MSTEQRSKAELLAAAQALLRQDDIEKTTASQQPRRSGLLIAILIACVVFIAMASLVAARHRGLSDAARPAAKSTVDGSR